MEFQLYHKNKLEEIQKNNFKITWKFIEIGYFGYEFIQPQISKQDICEYAEILLKNIQDNYAEIVQLIGERADDYEFNMILHKLSESDKSNIELQIHKWIIYLTNNMIENLKNEYFEDLLTMNEFWISLGQPKYSPHIFQAVKNNIIPQEYYTKKMYDFILNKHKEWIKCETEKIIKMENYN